MKKLPTVIDRALHPPKPVLLLLPPLVFSALIYIFVTERNDSVSAYPIYGMSAYCLTIIVLPLPRLLRNGKAAVMRRINGTAFGKRYVGDLAFRGSVGIYLGTAIDAFYVIFRLFMGIRYASVWFISVAVYYLVLGMIRLSLILSFRHRENVSELHCYRRTAWLLFVLNIPMGGMIALMVWANSGFTYPQYVIYLSAMYTFYTMAMSVVNLVKYRRLGSPILSAAKILNFIAALMSVLCLQTAMIAQFSAEGRGFRRTMNTVTGGVVWIGVILTAVYMLRHSKKAKDGVKTLEQIGE